MRSFTSSDLDGVGQVIRGLFRVASLILVCVFAVVFVPYDEPLLVELCHGSKAVTTPWRTGSMAVASESVCA